MQKPARKQYTNRFLRSVPCQTVYQQAIHTIDEQDKLDNFFRLPDSSLWRLVVLTASLSAEKLRLRREKPEKGKMMQTVSAKYQMGLSTRHTPHKPFPEKKTAHSAPGRKRV